MSAARLRTAISGFLAVAILAAATAAYAGTFRIVQAGETHTWRAQVYAGAPVYLTVDGDGDTDLDLYVYDANGRLVAVDDDLTDFCIGSWTPSFTGMVTIRIVNRGSVWNEYDLTVRGAYLR